MDSRFLRERRVQGAQRRTKRRASAPQEAWSRLEATAARVRSTDPFTAKLLRRIARQEETQQQKPAEKRQPYSPRRNRPRTDALAIYDEFCAVRNRCKREFRELRQQRVALGMLDKEIATQKTRLETVARLKGLVKVGSMTYVDPAKAIHFRPQRHALLLQEHDITPTGGASARSGKPSSVRERLLELRIMQRTLARKRDHMADQVRAAREDVQSKQLSRAKAPGSKAASLETHVQALQTRLLSQRAHHLKATSACNRAVHETQLRLDRHHRRLQQLVAAVDSVRGENEEACANTASLEARVVVLRNKLRVALGARS